MTKRKHDKADNIPSPESTVEESPREAAEPEHEVDVVPIEELEAAAEQGTLEEPAPSVGSVLLDAADPAVDAAVDTVADAAEALSDADPESTVEGAIPLSQVPVKHDYINYQMVGTHVSEDDAKAAVLLLPEGSFYKKNANDPRPGYRVYKRV